jgi:N-sulfoglucosamine sulfohydrolase
MFKKTSQSFLVLMCIALTVACAGAEESVTKDKPNILWIVSEDNSPFLGCYGDAQATTPHLDALAKESLLYQNAFANAPVCAPARSMLLTGMYPASMGTLNMRSRYAIPKMIRTYPDYLQSAGYYCTNNSKTDYNIDMNDKKIWDAHGGKVSYKKRKPGQPFFHVHNTGTSHESSIFDSKFKDRKLIHDPKKMKLAPYHPDTSEVRKDYARYYDNITRMDAEIGKVLAKLKKNGEDENTIVFYYADHGGVLARSKRFLYDSGTRVPLIIRFPKKFKHLAPKSAGSATDRIVTFVDFVPTLLSLAGVKIPEYIQGEAFLGAQKVKEREYAYLQRARMDERFEMQRAVRDKNFKYIKNFMPHRIYGQHLNYLWNARNTRSWEAEYKAGRCDKAQSIFWETKTPEELYDIRKDPHEVNNLAHLPEHRKTLERMRLANRKWMLQYKDAIIIPEGQLIERTKGTTAYELVRSDKLPHEFIVLMADKAGQANPANLKILIQGLKHNDEAVRYWAATGCAILKGKAITAKDELLRLLKDKDAHVRMAAAEALTFMSEEAKAMKVFEKEANSSNSKTSLYALNLLDMQGEASKAVFARFKKDVKKFDKYVQRVILDYGNH